MAKVQTSVQVQIHRDYHINLNTETTEFSIEELAHIAPVKTVKEAINAIDRHIASLNKGVRRKVLTLDDDSYSWRADEPRKILNGELTSWTNERGAYRRSIVGVVMIEGDRKTIYPEHIYEDTPQNRAMLDSVIELDKRRIGLLKESNAIIKRLERAALPEHLQAKAKKEQSDDE